MSEYLMPSLTPYQPSFCFTPAGIDACALWRMYQPHLNLKYSRFLFTQGVPPIDEIAETDIVVVQRMMTAGNYEYMKYVNRFGLKIVYDLDDNIWNIPKENPAHTAFTPAMIKGLEICMSAATVVTVSTKHLENIVKQKLSGIRSSLTGKAIPVVRIENKVDLRLFKPLNIEREKVVIGWGGSNTHSADLKRIWRVLEKVLAKYSHVRLELVGTTPPPDSSLVNHERVKILPWCHISEYGNRFATWSWDIILAPLEGNAFNLSKSGIKMIEAGAIGKPCLAQKLAPYYNVALHNKELLWLLCENHQWLSKIERLINDTEYRKYLGRLSRENVEKHYDIKDNIPVWKNLGYLCLRD